MPDHTFGKTPHCLSKTFIRNESIYKVRVTQWLSKYNIGHYYGVIENESNEIIYSFQSVNAPPERMKEEELEFILNRMLK